MLLLVLLVEVLVPPVHPALSLPLHLHLFIPQLPHRARLAALVPKRKSYQSQLRVTPHYLLIIRFFLSTGTNNNGAASNGYNALLGLAAVGLVALNL